MDHATVYANEWEFIDGIESASWTPAGGSPVANVRIVHDEITRRDMGRMGDLATEPTVTALVAWKATAATFTPVQGDRITDADGVAWVINQVVEQLFGTKYRLFVTKSV